MHHARTDRLRGLSQQTWGDGINRVRKVSFGFSAINSGVGSRVNDDAWFDARHEGRDWAVCASINTATHHT
jgi:hypothetical protein